MEPTILIKAFFKKVYKEADAEMKTVEKCLLQKTTTIQSQSNDKAACTLNPSVYVCVCALLYRVYAMSGPVLLRIAVL